jgi:hypothetical protein
LSSSWSQRWTDYLNLVNPARKGKAIKYGVPGIDPALEKPGRSASDPLSKRKMTRLDRTVHVFRRR